MNAAKRAREAAYADALRLHQFDLSEARRGNAACLCGEDLTTGLAPAGGVDRRLGIHQASVLESVADQETADLRAEVEQRDRALTALDRHLGEARDRAEAAEAESARLASEQRELAAQVAGLRSVVAKVEAIIADPDFANGHVSVVRVAAALASVGVSGSADDRREANASQAPDTATPGEVWVDTPDDFEGYDTATPGEAWKPGDPCASCGSTNTTYEHDTGAACRDCRKTDADEDLV